MPAGAYSLRSALIETLTRFKRPNAPIAVALRNTAAVVLPLVAGFATGQVIASLAMSVGALVVMFADQPGPYRERLRVISSVALGAGVSGLVGFLVGGHLAAAVPVLALWGFLAGMLVLFGPNMARVGMTSMILIAVAMATPLPWRQALATSTLILAGGALQVLFSIAAWPLQRYKPERLALAAVYRELAGQARRPAGADEAPPATATITRLQQTLLGRAQVRGRAMEAFHTLLELAERMRLEWMALLQEVPDAACRSGFDRSAAAVLDAIAEALERADPPTRAEQLLKVVEADTRTDSEAWPPGSMRHVQALVGQLSAAVRNANWIGSRGEIRARAVDTTLPYALRNVAPWATWRANLNLSSAAFRHGLRCAVVLAVALALERAVDFGRGYWVPMTAAIVLRADFGTTFNIGLLRVLGTLLGLVLTTALLYLAPEAVWAHLGLLALLCFAFRYLAGAHYGIAVVALTGTVVILLSFEGAVPATAVLDRVIDTAIGSALALTAYLVWPTWERGRAREALADMLAAYATYLYAMSSGVNAMQRREARSAARAARSNVQASLERLRTEPSTAPGPLRVAIALAAAGNRLVRALMALEAWLDDDGRWPCGDAMNPFLEALHAALRQMETAVRESRPLGDLPPLRQLQRDLARQLQQAPAIDESLPLAALTDRLADNIGTLAHACRSRSVEDQVAASRKPLS